MSSITTGDEITPEARLMPVTWAALILVAEFILFFGTGFVAYGRIDERVDHTRAEVQSMKDEKLGERMARIEGSNQEIIRLLNMLLEQRGK